MDSCCLQTVIRTWCHNGGSGNDLVIGRLGNDLAIFVVGEFNSNDLYTGGDETDILRVQETTAAARNTRIIHRSDVLGFSIA